MRLAAAGALALVVLVAGATAANAQAVRVLSSETLPTHFPEQATHEMRLSLYTFEQTRWNTAGIRAAVGVALPILAQCGIAAMQAEIITLAAPLRLRFFSNTLARELLGKLDVPRPAIVFVEETLNNPAFDAEAIGVSNSATRPLLANTVWVAYGTRDLGVTLAHELAHVLADSGEHSTAPGNLMREDTASANVRLDTAQCDRMRARGAANGLLGMPGGPYSTRGTNPAPAPAQTR